MGKRGWLMGEGMRENEGKRPCFPQSRKWGKGMENEAPAWGRRAVWRGWGGGQAATGLTGGWRRRMTASWMIIMTWFVVQ